VSFWLFSTFEPPMQFSSVGDVVNDQLLNSFFERLAFCLFICLAAGFNGTSRLRLAFHHVPLIARIE